MILKLTKIENEGGVKRREKKRRMKNYFYPFGGKKIIFHWFKMCFV
jgi:hypothetical protein